MVPVLEAPNDPSGGCRQLIREQSDKYNVPVFWHVPAGQYGITESWEGFNVDKEWLLRTRANKEVMHLVPITYTDSR